MRKFPNPISFGNLKKVHELMKNPDILAAVELPDGTIWWTYLDSLTEMKEDAEKELTGDTKNNQHSV